MNAQGIERFGEGVQAVLLSQPFFGTLLMKLKHEPIESCPTLFIDGKKIGYGPDFMAQQSMAQAEFCVCHEVLHAAWMHIPRIRHYLDTGIGPDGQPLDLKLFNQALDYPINASLVESKIGAIPAGITICLDPKYTSAWTPEEVYCDLKKRGGKGGGASAPGTPGGGDPDAMDDHQPGHGDEDGEGTSSGGLDAITPADVQQAVNVTKAMKGTLPAGIDRLIDAIKKPEQSPWRRLRRIVTKSLAGYDATSWRRLQRRMIVRGVGMPGRIAQGVGRVGVVGDTSGSIHDDVLRLFGGHMASIVDDAKPELTKIYWCDAKVHRVDDAKNGTQLRQILSSKIPGGGGTDMRKGVEAAMADKCDIIIVLTDGETPFHDNPKVIWAITNRSIRAPHGETLHIAG